MYKDIDYLKQVMKSRILPCFIFVPGMLETFLLETNPGECGNLRKVLCSGEALKAARSNLFKRRMPGLPYIIYMGLQRHLLMSPIGIVLMEKKKCCSFLSGKLSPIHGSIFWMGMA